MPETSPRRSALAEVYTVGTFEAETPDGPAVVLTERRPQAILHLAGPPGDADFRDGVRDAIGLDLPLEPNTVTVGEGVTVLWLAPDRWLIVSTRHQPRVLDSGLRDTLSRSRGAVTDVSDGRVVIGIAGRAVREVIAKGCPLDLHPRSFKHGSSAQSSLAKVNLLLHLVDAEPAFDLYIARSFAVSIWEWLGEAAGEYGYRVAPAQEWPATEGEQ